MTKPEKVAAKLKLPEPLPELLVIIVDQLADNVVPIIDLDLAMVGS